MKTLRTFLVLVLVLTAYSYAKAQNIVLIENKLYKSRVDAFFNNAPKYYVLEEGTVIYFQLKNQKKIRKEKVDNILFPHYVIIKDKPYNISKFQLLRFKQRGIWLKRLAGPIVFGSGAAIMGGGALIGNVFISGLTEGSAFVFAVTPITFAGATLGIGVIILGADLLIKGAKLTWNSFRRLKLDPSDPKLHSIQVTDKKNYKGGEILEEEQPQMPELLGQPGPGTQEDVKGKKGKKSKSKVKKSSSKKKSSKKKSSKKKSKKKKKKSKKRR